MLTLLADFAAPSLYPLVNSFNRSSEDYRIEVSNMNETGMSMELLQAELISGNGPDIFAFTDRNVLSAMNANAFVDLLPFLDADEEYGRETLVPGLLAALSADGVPALAATELFDLDLHCAFGLRGGAWSQL